MFTRRKFLSWSAGAFCAPFQPFSPAPEVPAIPADLDHILVGFPNLEDGIHRLLRLSGYRAAIGGSHPNRGTRNALLNLGNHCYLELLSPDPAQPALLWHKEIATLRELTILGWSVRHKDLEQFASLLRQRGVSCIDPMAGSRLRPDGQTLNWRMLLVSDDLQGNLPFFIDWDAASPHPSSDAPGGCLLLQFQPTGPLPEIPPPEAGMGLDRVPGRQSQYRADIAGRYGVFFLTSIPVPAERWVRREPAVS